VLADAVVKLLGITLRKINYNISEMGVLISLSYDLLTQSNPTMDTAQSIAK